MVNILKKMMAFNPSKRPAAKEILKDPIFDDIRQEEVEIKNKLKISS